MYMRYKIRKILLYDTSIGMIEEASLLAIKPACGIIREIRNEWEYKRKNFNIIVILYY